jgi:hypothetical protein
MSHRMSVDLHMHRMLWQAMPALLINWLKVFAHHCVHDKHPVPFLIDVLAVRLVGAGSKGLERPADQQQSSNGSTSNKVCQPTTVRTQGYSR